MMTTTLYRSQSESYTRGELTLDVDWILNNSPFAYPANGSSISAQLYLITEELIYGTFPLHLMEPLKNKFQTNKDLHMEFMDTILAGVSHPERRQAILEEFKDATSPMPSIQIES